jgi:hypothetical protein
MATPTESARSLTNIVLSLSKSMEEGRQKRFALVQPHIDAYDFFVGEGLSNAMDLLCPAEVSHNGHKLKSCFCLQPFVQALSVVVEPPSHLPAQTLRLHRFKAATSRSTCTHDPFHTKSVERLKSLIEPLSS